MARVDLHCGIVACSNGLSGSLLAAAEAPAMVVRMGERLGCVVPPNALPGVVDVWVEEGTSGGAYAAWCQRKDNGNRRPYDLVIATRSTKHPWAVCPSHIQLGLPEPFPHLGARTLPRDLPYAMNLSEFWYAIKDHWLVEQMRVVIDNVPTGPAIDIGVGDAGQLLLCLGKEWVMGGYH